MQRAPRVTRMLERGGDGGYHWGRAPIQQAVFDRLHGDVDPPDYWDSDESEPTRRGILL